MRKVRFFVTVASALLIATSFSFAHAGEGHRTMKIKVDGAGEPLVIDDLEVGESRQFYSDSGKEVVVTREEQGYKLSVDGREIDVFSPGDHHGASALWLGGEGEGQTKVFVKEIHTSAGEGENVFFFSGDEEGGHGEHDVFVWHEDDGDEKRHTFSFTAKAGSVLDQVLESGVLDKVDEATRQEIIDEIEKAERHRVIRTDSKAVVIDVDEDQ